jgi:hypothetical protein
MTTRKIISIPSDSGVNLFLQSIEEKYRTCSESLGAATGLRISEVLRIKHADLNGSDFST